MGDYGIYTVIDLKVFVLIHVFLSDDIFYSLSANPLHYFYMTLKFVALVVALTMFYASEVREMLFS